MKSRPVLFLVLLAVVSCNDAVPRKEVDTVIQGLSEDKWTYFSFEAEQAVGQSGFGDSEGDALWSARKDWDFAIAGDYIKTNGGTSGSGLGALARITTGDYASLSSVPDSLLSQDTVGIIR